MSSKNPVVHFEMPYKDQQRLVAFYEKAFGWKMNVFGADMQNYVTAETTETKDGRPVTPGAINGGFYPLTAASDATAPSVVVAVDDIQAAVKAVTEAGGKMLNEPTGIPGVGLYASFTDTEGNRASLLQPKM
jgi:predicted enzyme related to lactoylglutathione lyase